MSKVVGLSGRTFEKLTVKCKLPIEFEIANDKKKYKPTKYICECECGTTKVIRGDSLTSGKTVSCGCKRRENNSKSKEEGKKLRLDSIGKKFGRLKIIGVDFNASNKGVFICKCDCNPDKLVEVDTDNVLFYGTQSCGCLLDESNKRAGKRGVRKDAKFGTQVTNLTKKIQKNNSTGRVGVSKTKDGKYRAEITINKNTIRLGIRENFEEAVSLREEAELKYHKPVIDKYNNMKEGE